MKGNNSKIACSSLFETIWTLGVAVASGLALLSWSNGRRLTGPQALNQARISGSSFA